ncbi:pectin lyase-like protein, partial [Stereum hirsutum FP-91666 SS1]|uniref:pectin lyase-like protein n=1 Tax=Stereum hirsutum (strain FP-91666) TaxID=721885 RepID=UPI000444A14C
LYNINVANTYGSGKQATALSAHNSHQGYYGCSMTSYQARTSLLDTLLANSGYQYYSNCYIEGAVDYIYGGASAWFGECILASNGGGAITASSRDSTTDASYYVIDSSDVVAANSSLDLTEKVYLGRPWREYARVVFQRSSLSDIINPAGWTTLADPAEPIFEEYDNTGAGSDTSQRVTETTLTSMIQLSTVIPDYGDWIDETY